MADTTFVNGTAVEAAWLNDVNDSVYPGVPSPGTLRAEVFGRTAGEIAAGVVPTNYSFKPGDVRRYGADMTGATESTAAIQASWDTGHECYAPDGVLLVSPVIGLKLRNGLKFRGAGKNRTVIVASSGGGTMAQLIAYTQGSIISREFNVAPGTNDYLVDVHLSDFAVVLTHPTASVSTTGIQIGIDLRNVTRYLVERVHVGNIAPLDSPLTKSQNGAYDIQGYGIVVGNVASGESSYCGGEVGTIRDCSVWGAYKAITQDDGTLSPLSSAHAVKVISCDIQAAHHLLVQESQYATGNTWADNTLQSITKQPGDASNAFVVRCEGYSNTMHGGYIEAGPSADYLAYLGSASKSNNFKLHYYSATNMAAITDAGSKNTLEYFGNSGSIVGGVDSFGPPICLYDKAYRRAWVKFHWDGSAIVIDGGQGVASVTRTGAGDYTINWEKTFPSDDYALSVLLDTNASGHGGTYSVGSHSTSNVRIYVFAQNAGTTTVIDPRFVWVRAEQ